MSKVCQNMSKDNIRENVSSQYMLNGLYDSPSSQSETSENLYGNGEHFKESASQTSTTDYEKEITNKILAVRDEVEVIEKEIAGYGKEQLGEEFKKLEEILIQKTITLDNIDTKCIETLRELRKSTVLYIQDCLKLMDAKLK